MQESFTKAARWAFQMSTKAQNNDSKSQVIWGGNAVDVSQEQDWEIGGGSAGQVFAQKWYRMSDC